MRSLLKFIGVTVILILTTALHIGAAFVLPSPFSLINILFITILILLLIFESGWIVWASFFTHFIIELYSTTTPFGIILFSATITILFAYWIHKNIITNRSWYAGAFLALISFLVFRTIFSLILLFVDFSIIKVDFYWLELLIIFTWETLLSSIIVGLVYFIITWFRPSLKYGKVDQSIILRW